MGMKRRTSNLQRWGICVGLFLACAFTAPAQAAEELTIEKVGQAERIPIALQGFEGEVLQVLRFDLEIVGFRIVEPGEAQYWLRGRYQNHLEAWLQDQLAQQTLLARAYKGGTARQQAHALADDVVKKILGIPGIAQTKIAFRRNQNGISEIYVADYDGHNPIQITHDHTINAAPAWVPGRPAVYYVTYRYGNADIVLHDLRTGQRRFIARYSGSNISPAPSPDGQKVAMILSKAGSPDLYVADWDGSHLVQLTHTPVDEASPTWSPDGKQICFSTRIASRRTLAVISASGGKIRRLITAGVLNPTEPDWSPDGRWIAFTSQMGEFLICIIPATGGEARILAAGEDPVWGPNSRTLLYVRRVHGRRQLSLLDVFTKERKDVASNLGDCSQPTWAR